MSNRAIIERELTQGVVPIGTPKAYQYDQALVESAVATVVQGLTEIGEYTEEKKSEYLNYANTILTAIQNQYGYPFVAGTVSAMTDTTKIYVYTGSETGYTAGDWYYYDGNAWVSGGVFNSDSAPLKAEMAMFGVDDLLWDNCNPVGNTASDVTKTVDKVNKTVTMTGTASALTGVIFWNGNVLGLPSWLEKGKTYYAHMYSTAPTKNIVLQIIEKRDGQENGYIIQSVRDGYAPFTISADAVSLTIRVWVYGLIETNCVVKPFISETLSIAEQENNKYIVTNSTKNLFDYTTLKKDTTVDSYGSYVYTAGYEATDFIEVEEDTYYRVTANNAMFKINHVAFYDENHAFIRRIGNFNQAIITTDHGAKYIIVTSFDVGFPDSVQIEKGYVPTQYEPQKRIENIGINSYDAQKLDAFYNNTPFVNLDRNIDLYTFAKFIATQTHMWSTLAYGGVWASCVLLPVMGGDVVEVVANSTNNGYIAFLRGVDDSTTPQYSYLRDEYGEIVYDEDDNPVPDYGTSIYRNKALSTSVPAEATLMYIIRGTPYNGKIVNSFPSRITINGIIVFGKAQTTEPTPEYTTVFFDDFNEPLDADKWSPYTQTNRDNPTGNISVYRSAWVTDSDTAYTDSGCLVVKCKRSDREDLGNYKDPDGNWQPRDFVAGYVCTPFSASFKSGRISARIRLQHNLGSCFSTAFWTFGQGGNWPKDVEFDIAEGSVFQLTEPRTLSDGTVVPAGSILAYLANHVQFYNADTDLDDRTYGYYQIGYADWNGSGFDPWRTTFSRNGVDATKWHTYSIEWDEAVARFYVDDKLTHSISASAIHAEDADGNIAYTAPQYICFNIKARHWVTEQESSMFVDWVKVERIDVEPTTQITQNDVSVAVNNSVSIAPTIVGDNKAFKLSTDDTSIVQITELQTNNGMLIHAITGLQVGTATVRITSAGGLETTFQVEVTDS